MFIRVIAGEFRGRKLKAVSGRGTRPLLGQVRESVFAILGDRADGARAWDLFAGTGANGIEALSRGAERVVFVEKAAAACRVLRGNLAELPLPQERFQVLKCDAWSPPAGDPEDTPDLVFLDPPYEAASRDPARTLSRAAALMERLAPGGVLVFHYPEGVFSAAQLAQLGKADLRTWGRSAVVFVEKPGI